MIHFPVGQSQRIGAFQRPTNNLIVFRGQPRQPCAIRIPAILGQILYGDPGGRLCPLRKHCQFLRDRLRGKVYLPLAYFEGATPENGYQPCVPYTLNVLADPRPQDIELGYMRVFLKTSGADSPRPMKLRQKASTGEWFLWEYSSILSGIRIPAAEDPWA